MTLHEDLSVSETLSDALLERIENHPLKGNRSFVLRQGRLTKAQARAYECLPDYGIASEGDVDLRMLFGRQAPKVVEIGCGMGDTTASIAKRYPETDFLAVEVFSPGIGNLISLIQAQQLTNIRIAQTDAVDLFQHRLPQASLDGVHIFFPDPWPKKKHHKRRLIQPGFIRVLLKALKPAGYIHLATDWAEYAEQMIEVLDGVPDLVRLPDQEVARLSMRSQTKFESKGLAKGHDIVDLIYRHQPVA